MHLIGGLFVEYAWKSSYKIIPHQSKLKLVILTISCTRYALRNKYSWKLHDKWKGFSCTKCTKQVDYFGNICYILVSIFLRYILIVENSITG